MIATEPAFPETTTKFSNLIRPWTVPFLYLVLSIVLTWPLCFHLTTHLPMGNHDIWQNYWNFWWWKKALLQLHQSPYYTNLLFYPSGAPMGLHTHSEANILLTLPVNILFGIPAALNLAFFAGFFFSAWGAYLLARHYVPGHAAPFLAGIIFAFFPQHAEKSLEHLNLASVQGIPLFLWALVAVLRNSGWKYRILTGFLFALNALLGWHNAALVLPVGIIVAIFEMRKSGRPLKSLCADLATSACISIGLLLPFLYPIVRDVWQNVTVVQKPFVERSFDLTYFFIPHAGHPFWGNLFPSNRALVLKYTAVGQTVYVGLVALALALIGFFVRMVQNRSVSPISKGALCLWFSLLLFYLWLTLGETLAIGSRVFIGMPMPFRWLKQIPVFGLVRLPYRFLVPAMLSLSILSAMGAWTIANMLRRSARTPFFLLAAAFIILDFLWLPYPMLKVEEPVWIPQLQSLLKKVPADRAILDIPSGHSFRASKDMFLQTYHGRPITGGYISTRLHSVDVMLDKLPLLIPILEPGVVYKSVPKTDMMEMVHELKIGVIVVHLDRTVDKIDAQRRKLRRQYPDDSYKLRLLKIERGISSWSMNTIQQDLHKCFGPPVYVLEDQVEIYLVR